MKQLNFILFSFLIFSSPLFAGIFSKPKLLAINGQISSNVKNFDFSKLTIKESITCHQGWGDGRTVCGTKALETKVNSKGQFTLPELQGLNSDWGSAYYEIYLNDKFLTSAPYELNLYDNSDSIQKLLKNFTLYFIDAYEVNLTTDTGVDFDEWLKVSDNNRGISYVTTLLSESTNQDLLNINKILPNQYKDIAISKNHFSINEKVFLIPGDLGSISKNYKLSLIVGSQYSGNISSVEIYKIKVDFDDILLQEKISNIKLQTLLINYQLNGTWMFNPQISLELANSRLFIVADPVLAVESLCSHNILTGTLKLLYIDHQELNETRKLIGTCKNGAAEFEMNLKVFSFDMPQKSYQLNSRVFVSEIAGRGAEADILDLTTNIKYRSYGSFEKCTKIRKEGKYYQCDE